METSSRLRGLLQFLGVAALVAFTSFTVAAVVFVPAIWDSSRIEDAQTLRRITSIVVDHEHSVDPTGQYSRNVDQQLALLPADATLEVIQDMRANANHQKGKP